VAWGKSKLCLIMSSRPCGDTWLGFRRDGLVPLPSVIHPVVPWGSARTFRSKGSYLVDPASSHMLVSKIKPCMSKYKQLYSETANGSLNQL
jgi:hypothetical protein